MRTGLANAPPPVFGEGAGCPVPFSVSLREREMERREAPGRCATAPLHAPCDRGVYAPCGRVCETHPEARASRSGEVARLAARTLRLPALHREPRCRRPAPHRLSGSRRQRSASQHGCHASVRADFRSGDYFFWRVVARMERSEIRDANRTGPALRSASGLRRRDEPARGEPRDSTFTGFFNRPVVSRRLAPGGEG